MGQGQARGHPDVPRCLGQRARGGPQERREDQDRGGQAGRGSHLRQRQVRVHQQRARDDGRRGRVERVVHIIDSVLIPPAMQAEITASQNIVQLASATADLSTLVAAVKAGGLVDTLSSTGPFTVFAPTNEAFAKLPKQTLDFLLKPENKAKLVDILTYHVASGSVHAADLKNGEKIKTVEGKQVEARIFGSGKNSYVFINNARVTTADVDASNGVVHIIDSVLIPQAIQAEIETA